MTWKLECGFDNKKCFGATFKEDKGFKKSGGFLLHTYTSLSEGWTSSSVSLNNYQRFWLKVFWPICTLNVSFIAWFIL